MGPSLGFPGKKKTPLEARHQLQPRLIRAAVEAMQKESSRAELQAKLGANSSRLGPLAALAAARSEATHHGRSREAPAPARNGRGSSARVARRAAGGRRRAAGPASPPQGRLSSWTQLLSAPRGSGPAMV